MQPFVMRISHTLRIVRIEFECWILRSIGTRVAGLLPLSFFIDTIIPSCFSFCRLANVKECPILAVGLAQCVCAARGGWNFLSDGF